MTEYVPFDTGTCTEVSFAAHRFSPFVFSHSLHVPSLVSSTCSASKYLTRLRRLVLPMLLPQLPQRKKKANAHYIELEMEEDERQRQAEEMFRDIESEKRKPARRRRARR